MNLDQAILLACAVTLVLAAVLLFTRSGLITNLALIVALLGLYGYAWHLESYDEAPRVPVVRYYGGGDK